MSKLDRLIEESLSSEERAFFAEHGEKSLVGQFGDLFRGRLGWVNAVSALAQIAMFAGALYAARQVLVSSDAGMTLRWGLLAALLFLAMSVVKLMHWSQMQANRVIREIKRVELLAARVKK